MSPVSHWRQVREGHYYWKQRCRCSRGEDSHERIDHMEDTSASPLSAAPGMPGKRVTWVRETLQGQMGRQTRVRSGREREREVPPKPMRVNKREPLSVVQYVGLESDWHHVGRDLMMVVVSSRGTFSGSIPPKCAQNDKGRDRQRRIGGTG